MLIKPASPSQAADLSQIAKRSKAHWGYSAEQLKRWEPDLSVSTEQLKQYPCYFAEIHQQIAGFYLLIPNQRAWVLEHFWVLPANMGTGIGKALLSHACQIAKQAGAKQIQIDSDPNAEGFYLACGAKRLSSIPAPIKQNPARVRPQLLLATSMP